VAAVTGRFDGANSSGGASVAGVEHDEAGRGIAVTQRRDDLPLEDLDRLEVGVVGDGHHATTVIAVGEDMNDLGAVRTELFGEVAGAEPRGQDEEGLAHADAQGDRTVGVAEVDVGVLEGADRGEHVRHEVAERDAGGDAEGDPHAEVALEDPERAGGGLHVRPRVFVILR